MLGSFFIPLAPVGAPLVAMGFLIGQQLVTDPAMTIYDITDTSLRQTIVHDRQLGRVNSTVRVGVLLVQLLATLVAGWLGLVIGLRAALVVGGLVGLTGVLFVWFSPVRRLRTIEEVAPAD
ncbi:MAG TPA: hypothetical protein VH741_02075 [Candidatus Limnocylindrales bacterium]